jgi:hypothetical protein
MEHMLVDVNNLSRSFGRKLALDRVNFHVAKGRSAGLVGANGAGKTTLIKHLLGLLRAQSGFVRVFDHDPVRDPVAVLSRIGYISEERELPEWMRVDELMAYTQAFPSDVGHIVCAAVARDVRARPVQENQGALERHARPGRPRGRWIAAINLVHAPTNWPIRNTVIRLSGNLAVGVAWIRLASHRLTREGMPGWEWTRPIQWPTVFDSRSLTTH